MRRVLNRFARIAIRYCEKGITFFLTLIVFTTSVIVSPDFFSIPVAEAAQATIDSAVEAAGTSHLHSGSQSVFIDDQTGYKFYRDGSGECVYSKTTDGGVNWDAAVIVDDQGTGVDCIAISVWYDRWTPNDFGDYIHVATMDTGSDDIFYNRIDTANSDTRLTGATAATTNSGGVQGGVYGAGVNYPAITKGTDGTLYVAANDATDSYILRCSTSCGTASNWTEAGTNPLDVVDGDSNLLLPLVNGEIMIINRDVSLEDIRYRIWNGTNWGSGWTAIDANATDNTTYDIGMAAVVASSTVAATTTIYLAYTADNATPGTDDDIRTARYQNGVWSATGAVLTNDTKGLTGVAIGLEKDTTNVYVAYSGRTTAGTAATGNIYWKRSTDGMTSWGTQQGPINSSADDMYGVDLNVLSNQRLFASWFDNTDDDIYGDTIADLVPGIIVSATGTQTTVTDAPQTDFYTGGVFAFTEGVDSRDVTSITISENGSIDGSDAIENIELRYEMDTTAPYDCASVSYNGTESQFGSTDANGFSGADGTSAFTGSSITVSTSSAMCVYVVLDITDDAVSSSTLNVQIANPSTDVAVTSGETSPSTAVEPAGSSTIRNDALTQIRYHWRNDNGSETTATSRTGGVEGTALSAVQQNTPIRLRLEISNEGATSSPAAQYRLEYSISTTTCSEAYLWTDVGAADDDWNMFNSSNLTDGADTTNIATSSGGVTDENTTFLTPNGGVKDTSSQTGNITLSHTQYVELEYSIVASTSATEGNTYCFRATNQGTPLSAYSIIPRATIAADTAVTATSSQTATVFIPTTNFYIGGAYVITENTGSRNVTAITVTENGSVDAQNDLSNIRLRYENDTTAPYDCASVSYNGTELQYGATSTSFSGPNGTSTFNGSVAISTTSAMCVYVVLDVDATADNGDTLNIIVDTPSIDVVTDGGGSVSPTITRDITGSTTLSGPVLTQTHYHWRNDNGSEAAATSMTGGAEDTSVTEIVKETGVRLRLQISNEGATSSAPVQYRLEYSPKITSCSAATGWTDVGAVGGDFDMFNSSNLTDGADTTDIATSTGGVTNENTTFLTPNGGVKDTSSQTGNITLSQTQYVELEYSIAASSTAGYGTTYCFRVTGAGGELNAYTNYAELTTAVRRDFKIQRGTATVTGTGVTLTAGVDYVAPSASTSAFMRITNSHHTGAGSTLAGTQNADDVTAYISNPSNIMTSVTITRPGTALNNTRVSWEIVEFVGSPGSDNEMIVRHQDSVTYGTTATAATATAAAGIVDDADVVVFITGQFNPDTAATDYNTVQSTASWDAGTDQAVFTRGEASGDAVRTSFAVVEFVGQNWQIQRVEHTYGSAGVTETESITAVNSLSRTFVHPQIRVGTAMQGTDEFGHEAWLSGVGQASFIIQSGATTPSLITSVLWVVENIQTSNGAMLTTRSDGSSTGGTEPITVSVPIGVTISAMNNSSIFISSRGAGTGTLYPRPIVGATIASTTAYEIWRSDTGAQVNYRTEIVEWPTANTALRQNDYLFYADNNALDPTDPWPAGIIDLGENTPIAVTDEPLGDGERARIRMTIAVSNSTLPAGTKAFKLQFGLRTTPSCSAIAADAWADLGDSASSTVWRGYSATGTTDGTVLSGNPPSGGDLNIIASDRAGSLEEENDSVPNQYAVNAGEDIEYDWFIQSNGPIAESVYCFRMVEADGTPLDGYNDYPHLRTAGFTPVSQNWRWYDDEGNETPTTALANENIAPIDIENQNIVKLRVTVKETENTVENNARFRLQYSEYSDFSTSSELVATSSCLEDSIWCWANGGGNDQVKITTRVLSDADSCAASVGNGCGVHNESTSTPGSIIHAANAAVEYEFTIRHAGARVNRVYYFRVYDQENGVAVAPGSGETYPSLVTQGAQLVFTTSPLSAGTVTEGITTDVETSATSTAFGSLPVGSTLEAAQRFSITTNATEGYKILTYARNGLLSASGESIAPITGTNESPVAWSTGCSVSAVGCFGYHAGDDVLDGGGATSTRFSANDTYAPFDTTPQEIAYSSVPVTNDINDLIYRVLIRADQPAGVYEADIVFISVPVF